MAQEPEAILCVDDEAIILLSIRQELKSHFRQRFVYETASDAEQALRVISQLVEQGVKVILVLSDWLMPGMKGDEFLIEVKRLYPTIRSIMITGHANTEAIERALREAGTSKVIHKPWRREELIAAVENCIA